MTRAAFAIGATLFGAVAATEPAYADPCEGPLPTEAGTSFSGSVRYVGDGDSLCVGATRDPGQWIEVRLADVDAPELQDLGEPAARDRLIKIAFDRPVTCTATRGRNGRVRSFDRVIAICRVDGVPIGALLTRLAYGQRNR